MLNILCHTPIFIVIEKKEILHKKEVQKLRKQHTDTVSSLQSRYDALAKEYHSLESTTATRIERLEREKNDLLARLKAMLDMLNEKLKEAVKAFLEFSKSVLRELSIRYRDTIVEYLADSPDVRNAAHTLKVFARPFLDNRQFDKGCKELDRLTSNFPAVMEEVNRTQNRCFRR